MILLVSLGIFGGHLVAPAPAVGWLRENLNFHLKEKSKFLALRVGSCCQAFLHKCTLKAQKTDSKWKRSKYLLSAKSLWIFKPISWLLGELDVWFLNAWGLVTSRIQRRQKVHVDKHSEVWIFIPTSWVYRPELGIWAGWNSFDKMESNQSQNVSQRRVGFDKPFERCL